MWTTEQVLALAPDSGSAAAGKGLAVAAKWVELGAGPEAGVIWGLCKGSGSEPYKTRVSLAESAFKCTCPSRKFPCKHSLGLMLLYAAKSDAFSPKEIPPWVAEWIASRGERAAKKAEKAEAVPDPAAQAKRAARREGNVAEGIDLLERWLLDLIRQGLAHAQTQPANYWQSMAARMVDSQAPGLARRVREMSAVPHSGDGWPGRLLRHAASLHLLMEGWRGIERLDPLLREDVRSGIGFTLAREEVLAQPGTSDVWLVAGHQIGEEPDGLRVQRIWLAGEKTGATGLIVSFSHRTAPAFDVTLPFGARIEAEIAFYPSAVPQRALLKQCGNMNAGAVARLPSARDIESVLGAYADAIGKNPWIESIPVALEAVTPCCADGCWSLRDPSGRLLPMRAAGDAAWRMTAICGGDAAQVFGEWNGEFLVPLSMAVDGALFSLAG